MIKKPFLTIIIPVFNAEKTISKCIESIINQNHQNFELILINDGSTDSSADICDKYASKYSQIRVFHSKNWGPGPARNKGIELSNGEYLFFVDSDDWIKKNTLSDNARIASTMKPDLIVFGYTKKMISDSTTTITHSSLPDQYLESKQSIKNELCCLLDQGARFSLWNKFFNNEIILKNNIKFPDFKRSQDMAFTLDFLSKAESMYIHNSIYYVHENQFISEKYDDSIVEVHKILFEKLFHLFPDWNENKNNVIYLAKMFAFWFFLKIPKIMIANHRRGISIKKIEEMTSKQDIKNYSRKFLKKGVIPLRFRAPIFLLNKQAYRLIYIINFILKPMEDQIKKIFR